MDAYNLARENLLEVIGSYGDERQYPAYNSSGAVRFGDVVEALDAYDAARIPEREALARLLRRTEAIFPGERPDLIDYDCADAVIELLKGHEND